jgi:prepilin-type processing-associated H-X9-DG protein
MTKRNQHFCKPDPVVLGFCVVVLVSCLGAVGEQGRRRAKEMVCLANLQQWGSMFESYTKDHDGNFNPGWAVGETELWMNALRPYYGDRWPLLLCPTATKLDDFYAPSTFAAWMRDVGVPGEGEHRYVSSYGINSWTNAMTRSLGSRMEEWFWKTPEGVARPDRVPVFADAIWHDAWPLATDAPLVFPVDLGGSNTGVVGEMGHFCIDRHSGGVNMLFMDWSARKVGLKELWALEWHRSYDIAGPWTTAGGVLASDWPEWMRGFKDYQPD